MFSCFYWCDFYLINWYQIRRNSFERWKLLWNVRTNRNNNNNHHDDDDDVDKLNTNWHGSGCRYVLFKVWIYLDTPYYLRTLWSYELNVIECKVMGRLRARIHLLCRTQLAQPTTGSYTLNRTIYLLYTYYCLIVCRVCIFVSSSCVCKFRMQAMRIVRFDDMCVYNEWMTKETEKKTRRDETTRRGTTERKKNFFCRLQRERFVCVYQFQLATMQMKWNECERQRQSGTKSERVEENKFFSLTNL